MLQCRYVDKIPVSLYCDRCLAYYERNYASEYIVRYSPQIMAMLYGAKLRALRERNYTMRVPILVGERQR